MSVSTALLSPSLARKNDPVQEEQQGDDGSVLKLIRELDNIDFDLSGHDPDDDDDDFYNKNKDSSNDDDFEKGNHNHNHDYDSSTSPRLVLTEELLSAHDQFQNAAQKKEQVKAKGIDLLVDVNVSDIGGGMERRQFNCPECPKRGRGKFVFFKNVPAYKPIVKCPQCKKAAKGKSGRGKGGGGGDVVRLYALPKVCEKGYGLFKCVECQETWGSSRAIGHIGQECYNCKTKRGKIVYVKPFRLEVVKNNIKNKGGILGGGPGRRMRRVPKQSIGETQATHVGYTDDDHERNRSSAENALVFALPRVITTKLSMVEVVEMAMHGNVQVCSSFFHHHQQHQQHNHHTRKKRKQQRSGKSQRHHP
jgi:hypothetical protein